MIAFLPFATSQKGSPYLEDVNELIEQAKQMGLIDAKIGKMLPNATKCNTLQDIQASYLDKGQRVSLKFEDVRGIMSFYLLCICFSVVTMVVEITTKCNFNCKFLKHIKIRTR